MKITFYEVQSFLSSDLIIYKFPACVLIYLFIFPGGSAWDTSLSNNYFMYLKQLCMNVS